MPLSYPPGQHWAYSNFGYCLLGRVIEQVTGQAYADYVQSNVLAPCGISGMRIAGNTLRQRAANEVVYFGQYGEDPYKMNVARMDSDAGWLATSSALVQFLNHVGGSGNIPSLLKPETIRTMTTPSPAFPGSQRLSTREAGWSAAETGGITGACRGRPPSWYGQRPGCAGQHWRIRAPNRTMRSTMRWMKRCGLWPAAYPVGGPEKARWAPPSEWSLVERHRGPSATLGMTKGIVVLISRSVTG